MTMIDISDPSNLTIVGNWQHPALRDSRGIAIAGAYAYVTGHDSDSFLVFSIDTTTTTTVITHTNTMTTNTVTVVTGTVTTVTGTVTTVTGTTITGTTVTVSATATATATATVTVTGTMTMSMTTTVTSPVTGESDISYALHRKASAFASFIFLVVLQR